MFCRVYGISLSKTGTTSLYQAMRILGYKNCRHYFRQDLWFSGVNKYGFANDMPVYYEYKQLDFAFPGSKFIYTDRPVDQWIKSFEYLWNVQKDKPGWRNWVDRYWGVDEWDGRWFRGEYARHRDEVMRYFEGREEDLLVRDIGSGWDDLCEFLDCDIPDEPYPFVGATNWSEAKIRYGIEK